MSLLPANVGTGYVTGVFVNSDGQAETGKAWLRPRFTSAKITTAEPPTTVLPTPRSVQIGEDGRMAETEVVATSDPDLGLEAWTYEVTFKFDSGVSYGPFDIAVPEGETVDLTLVAPAATANGVQTIRGFGVPDPADAEDGDVVSYDATEERTTWWSPTDTITESLTAELADPESPLRTGIDEAAGRVADEALESRLSRTERSRHAPSLGLYFPDAEGAVGDGHQDDTAAIQAALSAAAATGATVLIGPGTYLLSSSLNPTGAVVQAYGAVMKPADGASFNLIRPTGTGVVEWRGGTIDGNRNNLTGSSAAVFCNSAVASLTIRDLTIADAKRGIQILTQVGLSDPAAATSGPVKITECTVQDTDSYGISISRCSDVILRDCASSRNAEANILVTLCRNVAVTGNIAEGSASHGINIMYSTDVRVSGNNCLDNGGGGVVFGGGSTTNIPNSYGTVTGNTCRGNTDSGIILDLTIQGQLGVSVNWHGSVQGNMCTGNGTHGIVSTNTSGIALSGNTCRGNVLSGIQVNANDAGIEGNTCTGNGSRGIAFFTHGAGVRVGANNVRGNSLGGYHVDAGVSDAPLFAQLSVSVPSP